MSCTSSVTYQYLAVFSSQFFFRNFFSLFIQVEFKFLVNMLSISYGIACSWSSSSVLTLKSLETPINNGIPMTDSEIAWIASLLALGGLAGTILTGSLADIYGRKKTLLALAFPHFVRLVFSSRLTELKFLS